jgi:predicted ATPase/signal transduction histidine kinase/GAF domain-containing protein
MSDLSNYELSPLRDGEFPLHRARRGGERPILVVGLPGRNASAALAARLEREFALRSELDAAWAARPSELTRYNGAMALVLEDPGGEPLERLLGRPWDVAEFLEIAIPLAGALRQAHDRGLVHKDIRPANILADVQSRGAWLTGFGLASRAPGERPGPDPPEVAGGALAYMAPEQTGRMNRATDSRSDLYGLGVVLYEMLTGAPPFTAADPMELIHSHIARQPASPSERIAAVPAQLSAIVLKLLAKTPEQRYQTAAGLEADLRRCLALYEAQGRIDPFPPGADDVSDRLVIPERLYGRQAEAQSLLAAFERVAALGETGVVLVSGASGAGKSALVNELRSAVVARGGRFASGKFDQYLRDVPYATLAQAFQGLVRDLLGRSEAELRGAREALHEALGANAQLIVNLVPELELVLGKQPAVTDLSPQDAQRRFQMVFRRFLGVFANETRPLVLFMDDLQWLDAATLELLQHLATHPDVKGLLLIGAYRLGKTGPSSEQRQAIEAIRQSRAELREIALAPLSTDDFGQLVVDTLRCPPNRAEPLARLLHEKTAGNPFFAVQFLTSLAQEGLLVFDSSALAWRWDIDRIRAKSYSDNVVDLVTDKLGRLSGAAQDALKNLACLGNTADVATLALVHGPSEAVLQSVLAEAVETGLIVCQGDAYAFLHDRIQQAAYALIPEDRRAEFHLRLGRALLKGLSPDALDERVFDVASQFNRGAGEFVRGDEASDAARLNLQAGRRAKASAAYASAAAYLAAGAAMLGEEDWERQYQLLFQLRLERAECEYLRGDLDGAEQLIDELIERAAPKLALAAAYFLKVQLCAVKQEHERAAACWQAGLELLGVTIPARPTWDQVLAEFDDLRRNLEGRSIESLIDLPLMTDPELLAAMRLLATIFEAIGLSDLNLWCLYRCRMANISLRHGVSGASATAFVFLAVVLDTVFGRYHEGDAFAKLAGDLTEKHGFTVYEAKVQQSMALVALWTQPVATALELARSACRITTEVGDVTTACYSHALMIGTRLFLGDPLEAVWRDAQAGLELARAAGFRGGIADVIFSQQRFIANMQGRTANFSTFSEPQFDQDAFEAALGGSRVLSPYWILKLRARCLSGDYAQALAAAEVVAPDARSPLTTSMERLNYHYYTALSLAALFDDAADDARAEWRAQLEAHQAELRGWAEINPATFSDKHALVAAEIARIGGRDAEAMRLYEQAIQAAREHGFVQHEALAYEVASRFYAARGLESIAHAYLRAARRGYLRWGAEGKVRQLEQLHPHLRETPMPMASAVAGGAAIARFDAEAVVRASQALSSEIRLGELIQKLMQIALEHAGAERGLLVLHREGELKLEAEAVTGHAAFEVNVREADVTASDLPLSMLNYVVRTQEGVVLDDASLPNPYRDDTYVQRSGVRSVLCLPIGGRANLVGALYLENRLTPYAFTSERVTVLKMLASQAAISLENARLYSDLQQENSDRKRAEEELRRSEAHLQEAQRLGRMGSFVLDPVSGSMPASPELLRILGRDPGDGPSTLDQLREHIHPDDRRRVREATARAMQDKVGWTLEYRILRRDGSVGVVESGADPILDAHGDVIEYIGHVIDVTERKASEQRAKMSETLLSEAQRLSHTGSYVLDGPFGRSIWTDEMFRIFEFDRNEAASVDKAIQRIHPDDQDRMRQFAATAPEDRPDGHDGMQAPVEYRLLMPDGRVKYVVSLRGWAGPEFSGVGTIIGATMDVTDRKRAEEALLRSQADLAHASRVNTMGELTAALAHEVNQPITAAVTNADACLRLLAGDTPDIEEAREAAMAIARAGRRAADIVSRTRDLFKKRVPQPELLDLDDVLRGTLVLLESEATRHSVSIRTWLAAGSTKVMGDRVQLQQVIMNLVMNGIDAMKDVEGDRELAILSRPRGDGRVEVSIRDDGVGLPAQDADRIFETFFTTKAEGTGMGLSISRSIVEAHGGQIWAEPDPMHGTIFHFALPVAGEL